MFGDSAFAACCVGLHRFASKFLLTVEKTVKLKSMLEFCRLRSQPPTLARMGRRRSMMMVAFAMVFACARTSGVKKDYFPKSRLRGPTHPRQSVTQSCYHPQEIFWLKE